MLSIDTINQRNNFGPRIVNKTNLVTFTSYKTIIPPQSIQNFASKISKDTLSIHLNKLASPEMEGRGVGQMGIERAKNYIADEFKKIGLGFVEELGLNDYFQKFSVPNYKTYSEAYKGYYKGHLDKGKEVTEMVETSNILGIIKGKTYPDDYLLLTAHYDHLGKDTKQNIIYPGADDNASSVSTLLEIARIMKQDGQNEKSVIFVALSAEESYKLGAEKLIQELQKFGIAGRVEVLNVEMLGACGGKAIDVWREQYSLSQKLVQSLKETSKIMKVPIKIHYLDPGSDAKRFANNNIPAVCVAWSFMQKKIDKNWSYKCIHHKYYHSSKDTPGKINMKVFEHAARLISAFSYVLANKSPEKTDKIIKLLEQLKNISKQKAA